VCSPIPPPDADAPRRSAACRRDWPRLRQARLDAAQADRDAHAAGERGFAAVLALVPVQTILSAPDPGTSSPGQPDLGVHAGADRPGRDVCAQLQKAGIAAGYVMLFAMTWARSASSRPSIMARRVEVFGRGAVRILRGRGLDHGDVVLTQLLALRANDRHSTATEAAGIRRTAGKGRPVDASRNDTARSCASWSKSTPGTCLPRTHRVRGGSMTVNGTITR